jgi:hypothetical protein
VNTEIKQQYLKLNYRAGYFANTTGTEPAPTRKRSGNQ